MIKSQGFKHAQFMLNIVCDLKGSLVTVHQADHLVVLVSRPVLCQSAPHDCPKVPELISLQREKVYFVSWFWRIQDSCSEAVARQCIMVGMCVRGSPSTLWLGMKEERLGITIAFEGTLSVT